VAAGRQPGDPAVHPAGSAGTVFVIVMSCPAAPNRRLMTSRPPFVPLA